MFFAIFTVRPRGSPLGRLPHQSADWFAMTDKQDTRCALSAARYSLASVRVAVTVPSLPER